MSHDTRSDKMVPVTAGRPCPVCEKPDWCLVAPDGTAAICQRVEAGSVKRCGDAGWLHVLVERPSEPRRPRASGKKKPTGGKLPTSYWQAEAMRFAAFLTADTRAKLTAALGLPAGGLDCLPLVGLSPGTADTGFTTWPETDAGGQVIGINRRWKSGAKKAMPKGRRGLTLPAGWRDRPGPVLVVEGPTDAAALTAGGLCAVGTFSTGAGGKLLAELLTDWPAERDILIVGENDRKDDGNWPGQDGATRLATDLAKSLGRPIRWALTPDGAKDARAWMTAPDRGDTPWPERGTAFAAKLLAGAEVVNPPASAAPSLLARFAVGDRVSPTDRENVGTVADVLSDGRNLVHFAGENGEAEVEFGEAELRPYPPPPDGLATPAGGNVVVPDYRPFPVDALPVVLRQFVAAVGAWADADPVFAALPALAVAGAAAGLAVAATPSRGYAEPPLLWACMVADSGTGKSPCLKPSADAALAIDRRLKATYLAALDRYETDAEAWKAAGKDPATKPPKPKREYFFLIDTTIERLAENIGQSPRGVVVVRDELSGWFGSFTRYAGKVDGSDLPNWLSLFDAGPIRYQRRTGEPRDVEADRGFVAVCGGIQPAILRDVLGNPAFLSSGLSARLIYAMPPKRCPGYTDAELDGDTERRFAGVLDFLRNLPCDAKAGPAKVGLDLAALARFRALSNEFAATAEGTDGGPMSAALPKASRLALRLALVWHCVEEAAAGRDPAKSALGEAAMSAGETLARWFVGEAERVYAMLAERPEDRAARRLAEWVRRRGGRATARDLQRSNKNKYATADAADAALTALAAAGVGYWDTPPATGGRPANRTFVLGCGPQADSRQKPTEPADSGEDGPDPDADDSHPRADERPSGRQKPDANPLETSYSDNPSAFVGCRLGPGPAAEDDPTVPASVPPEPAKTRREYVPNPMRGVNGKGGGR